MDLLVSFSQFTLPPWSGSGACPGRSAGTGLWVARFPHVDRFSSHSSGTLKNPKKSYHLGIGQVEEYQFDSNNNMNLVLQSGPEQNYQEKTLSIALPTKNVQYFHNNLNTASKKKDKFYDIIIKCEEDFNIGA